MLCFLIHFRKGPSSVSDPTWIYRKFSGSNTLPFRFSSTHFACSSSFPTNPLNACRTFGPHSSPFFFTHFLIHTIGGTVNSGNAGLWACRSKNWANNDTSLLATWSLYTLAEGPERYVDETFRVNSSSTGFMTVSTFFFDEDFITAASRGSSNVGARGI